MTPGLCQTLFPTWNYSFIALRKPVVDNLLTQKKQHKSEKRGNDEPKIKDSG